MERGPHLSRATTARKPLLITLHSYSSSFPSKSQFNIVIIIIIVIVVSLSLFEKNCRHRGKDGKISARRKSESGSERNKRERSSPLGEGEERGCKLIVTR